MQLPTVKIEGENGDYVVINEADFDEKRHKLFDEDAEKKDAPKKGKNGK